MEVHTSKCGNLKKYEQWESHNYRRKIEHMDWKSMGKLWKYYGSNIHIWQNIMDILNIEEKKEKKTAHVDAYLTVFRNLRVHVIRETSTDKGQPISVRTCPV